MGILKRLEEALELYRSDKIKERSQGHDQLRDLLHNRDTILRFADAAQESSARPWISLFSCVMNAVHSEKVLMSKKDTAAQKQRLSNAISIVRLVAEQSVHHIGRLSLLALIGTMRQQLLWSRKIYEPALIDYSKAIVTLLSHPPHLEVLDRASWLSLMSISFAVILGDEVKCESDDDPDTLGVMLELKIVEEEERSGKRPSLSTKQIPVSNSNESFVKLVPILLSSGTAPIIPPSLNQGDILSANQRVGLGLLLKLRRFFVAQPHVTVYHPHLLKALNILLTELELNHRESFTKASIKILPQLVTLWSNSVRSQDRSVVDQVVIAIRTILPHMTHPAMEVKYVAEIRSSLEILWEVLSREAGSKRLEYLDMGCLRLKSRIQGRTNLVPFESVSFSAGYHFSVSQAFSWAALELYSDCCTYLYLTRSSDIEIGRNGSTPKRRKVEHTLSSLLSAVNLGKFESRLLALQTLIFLIGRQWSSLEMETQQAVFQCLHALLNDENEVLQSWAFLGLATAAVISTAGFDFHTDKTSDPTLITHTSLRGNRKAPPSNDENWNKVWSHAVRKCYVPATSRAASHLTAILIQLNLLDHNTIVGGIRSLLQSVEIEGPPASLDSLCVLHTIALEMAQSDIQLYSLGLEEKVLAWLEKIWAGDKAVRSEGSDGRLEQRAPSDLLGLLSAISGVQPYSLVEPTVDEFVPESAVSKHLFEEAATQSIRDFVLYQKFPQPPSTATHIRAVTIGASEPENSSPLGSRCLRVSLLMSSMMRNDLVQEQGKSFIIHNHLAERTRRSIDLVVLVYAYQASLCLNGYTAHTASLQAATRLFGSLLPTMASHDLPLPDFDLIWRGLRCLVADTGKDYDVDRWPILVMPGTPSGIRTDLLPQQQGPPASTDSGGSPTATSTQYHSTFPSNFPSTYTTQEVSYPVLPQDSTGDALVHAIWRLPTVTTTLKGLFEPCLQIARRSRSSDPVNSQLRAAGGHDSDDDDDFSGMSVEDAAVLPSKETPEKRASASILHSVVCFRLKGGKLAQNASRAYKDPSLINCFLQSDAPHSFAVGLALCEAIHKGWLRINLEAVQLVVDELNGLIGSYSYRYDEAAWSFAFAFLRCSASAWLLKADTKLFEACMKLVHFVAARVLHGTPMSWRLKYDLLQFLEDFTSYEKAIQLWAIYPTEDTRNEEIAEKNRKINELWVLAAQALRDDDIRIRVRASTMAGNAFYRPILGLSQHLEFYQSCSRQSQDEAQIDHFVTDILWNVNCCVASAAVRQTAVLMLCNLAINTSAGLPYIQAGLSTAAGRLGLSSASTLCLPYCAGPLIAQAHTNTANSLSRILGFSDRNALHVACLKACGPYLLYQEQSNFYSRACESIHLPTEEVIRQNFPEIASVIMALSWSVNQRDKNIKNGLVRLAALPGIDTVETAKELLEDHVDAVRAHVWELIDLNTTPEDIISLLKRENIESATFREIQPPDTESSPGSLASTALQPSVSVDIVYDISSSLAARHGTSSSNNEMVFAAVLRLTFLINEAFLVSEQDRHLCALFCLIAVNAKAFRQKIILGTFLHEVLALLNQPNLSHTVFPMVKWGFTRLTTLTGTGPTNTTNLFLQLGRVWSVSHRAVSVPRQQYLAHLLENWITSVLPGWETSTVKDSFLQAAALWPDDVRSRLNTPLKSPTLWELRNLSEANIVGTGSELCKQFKKLAEDDYTGKVAPAFMASAFWTIKSDMGRAWDPEGISAFQELLYMAGGEIHSAPPIGASPRQPTANGAHDIFLGISDFTVRLLDDRHYGVRAAAYRTLQGMKPHVSAAGIETRLSPVEHNLYEILEPLVLAQSQKEYRLSDILDRSSWDSLLCNTEEWALDLARLLCNVASRQDPFYLSINPLLSSQVPLRHLLPYLVHAVLICDTSNKASPKDSQILARYFEQVVQSSQASTETIQAVIDISLYLRQYQAPRASGKEDNEWLGIDLVTLSQAAIRCDSYVTALLFLELARDQCVPPDLTRSNIQRIMYDVYSNVDEPDGFYGVQNNDARDALSRRLKHEGSSWAALAWDGAIFNAASNGPSTILPVVRNLHDIGFSRLASSVVSQAEHATNATTEDPFFAELGWRTGNWTLPLSTEAKATPSGLLYEALSAVHKSRDLDTARVAINEAVQISIEELSKASREKMSSIESITTNLLCLRELQEWNRQQSEDSPNSTVYRAGENFEDSGTRFEFSIAEKIIAVRMSLIHSTKHRESQYLIGDMESPGLKATVEAEKACHLQLCKLALKDGRMQTAINSITAAQRLEDTSRGSEETQDLFCEVLWKQGEHGLAIQLVETRIKEEKGSSRDLNGVVSLRDKLALWTSSARLRSAEEIKSTFEDAVSRVKKFQLRKSEHARLYYHFACFSHQQHISLANTSEFKRLEEREKRRQAGAIASQSLGKGGRRQSKLQKGEIHLAKFAEFKEAQADSTAFEDLKQRSAAYLRSAQTNYIKALCYSDEFDNTIMSLVTLWFENDQDQEANQALGQQISTVPSHKFIFLAPQITARLNQDDDKEEFAKSLHHVVLRVCQDHPYHILYQVITLAHAPSVNKADHGDPGSDQAAAGRAAAASNILEKLSSLDGKSLSPAAAKSMQQFVDIAVDWTLEPIIYDEDAEGVKKRSGSLKEDSILNKTPQNIPIATKPPPIDCTCKYDNIALFSRYQNTFTIAGGISTPKVMTCYDNKGHKHTQLFKRDDGFRQDTVMEQVFERVNHLLQERTQSKRRHLRFRTYTVVAFPLNTGVIDFVPNTMPIGDWLRRAHTKYRPHDITASTFSKRLAEPRSPKQPKLDKSVLTTKLVEIFKTCKKSFRPVMRHFFTEKHRDPVAWLSMRTSYGRSVAVTSMTGWVLGIGDRHCSNILIDNITGELVHIDFGVAFEAGTLLPIAEHVPFRLTDDLVDALGITGVEGVMRRCSQLALQVLIDSSDVILTILEVFKHDPLHSWSSAEKQVRAQGGGHDVLLAHEKSDRVLGKVREKLSKELSVEYRVNQLIQEARDVNNLATIYTGKSEVLSCVLLC